MDQKLKIKCFAIHELPVSTQHCTITDPCPLVDVTQQSKILEPQSHKVIETIEATELLVDNENFYHCKSFLILQ